MADYVMVITMVEAVLHFFDVGNQHLWILAKDFLILLGVYKTSTVSKGKK